MNAPLTIKFSKSNCKFTYNYLRTTVYSSGLMYIVAATKFSYKLYEAKFKLLAEQLLKL